VPEVAEPPHWPYVVLGAALALLGVLLAVTGWWRHDTVDRALTGGEEAVAPGWLTALMGGALALFGVALAVLLLAG
jgi:uncharacterized membrane protein YidH (DUF202 family)